MSYANAVRICGAIDRRLMDCKPGEVSRRQLLAYVAGYWGSVPLCARARIERYFEEGLIK